MTSSKSNDLFDDSAFDEREPLIPAQMWIGQLTLVEAELAEDGRVEVAEVDGSLDGAQANGVGGAQHLAAFDSSARQPHAEAEIVVVAALAGFRLGRTAKFTAPQHQRAVEQSASLQILQEPRDGLVGFRGFAEMILFDVIMRVPLQVARPAAGNDTNKAHAIFHQLARQQTAPAIIVCRLAADAIKIERLLWLFGKIKQLRRLGLHFESQIVSVNA